MIIVTFILWEVIAVNDGNAFLASEVSLSCIEEYFLSQIYRKKEQKYLFFESSISVQRIWQDQMINKNGFANVKCVERIHDLAKQRKLIDFCYAENTSIDYNADYIAVEVKNARSMRNDHYILVKSINDSQVYSFDTLSNQEGVCTKEKIKRLRQTRTIHFYYIEQEAQSTWIYDSQEKFENFATKYREKNLFGKRKINRYAGCSGFFTSIAKNEKKMSVLYV